MDSDEMDYNFIMRHLDNVNRSVGIRFIYELLASYVDFSGFEKTAYEKGRKNITNVLDLLRCEMAGMEVEKEKWKLTECQTRNAAFATDAKGLWVASLALFIASAGARFGRGKVFMKHRGCPLKTIIVVAYRFDNYFRHINKKEHSLKIMSNELAKIIKEHGGKL
jgi:hypothetical protein